LYKLSEVLVEHHLSNCGIHSALALKRQSELQVSGSANMQNHSTFHEGSVARLLLQWLSLVSYFYFNSSGRRRPIIIELDMQVEHPRG
jgi:hypothetical protein